MAHREFSQWLLKISGILGCSKFNVPVFICLPLAAGLAPEEAGAVALPSGRNSMPVGEFKRILHRLHEMP